MFLQELTPQNFQDSALNGGSVAPAFYDGCFGITECKEFKKYIEST
jgi:hypothetical protein